MRRIIRKVIASKQDQGYGYGKGSGGVKGVLFFFSLSVRRLD